ncbi:hypothetical protein [Mucilaginibacter sp. UR6-11]|uniref:hypothetical protein n=1 Tax=Mucilaginibacter sp. UR6-11 TaxID=1435644 RepID=UPI001E5D61AF|nr:hypothetical protein [Mucilaginibacter sp. UR6-11]MCC8425799.1 hypothetical protein [Mucilaginibacter sp. UR6-11]
MKKSTKIFIAAILVLLASLAIHDLGLRAAYLKGDYKKPYYGFEQLDLSAFDRIQLDAATAANLKIEQGPFQVRVNPQAKGFLRLKQENGTLHISAEFPEHYQGVNAPYVVYVRCPELQVLKVNARYTFAGHPVTDTSARDPDWKPTLVSGFKADSLYIEEDFAANVRLENNQLRQLHVVAGVSRHAGSALTIGAGNIINKADLDIRNYSLLRLQGITHGTTNYKLADGAHLAMDGLASKPFIKNIQP